MSYAFKAGSGSNKVSTGIIIPMGYEQITAANLVAASALKSIPAGPGQPSFARINVSGGVVAYRDDGTAPTTTVGMNLTDGTTFDYGGNLGAIQFIAVSGTPNVNVSYYG